MRLSLDGFSHVEGATLQEAADALVAHMLRVAMAFRAGGFGPVGPECGADREILDFVWRLGDHVAARGDPRDLLFGPTELEA